MMEISDKTINKLITSVKRSKKYRSLSDKDLADKLVNDIWALYSITSPEADLISEAVERIESRLYNRITYWINMTLGFVLLVLIIWLLLK